jgi:hypothetical protein
LILLTTEDGLAKIVYGLEVETINRGDTRSDKKFGLSADGADHLLADYFLACFSREAGIKNPGITKEAKDILAASSYRY